jgi:hypothetical protein
MAHIIEKYEFPCGLKVRSESKGLLVHGKFDVGDVECPLHGKNCVSKGESK